MSIEATPSEADIMERIVAPESGGISPGAAREILKFSFDRETTGRIRRLLQQNNRGTISVSDRLTLEKYLRVGQFFDLLRAKAQSSLKKGGRSS